MPEGSAPELQRPPVALSSRERDRRAIDEAVTTEARGRLVVPADAARLVDRHRVIVDRVSGRPDPGSVRDSVDHLLNAQPELVAQAPGVSAMPESQEIASLKAQLADREREVAEARQELAQVRSTAAVASVIQREAAAIGFVHADLVHKLVDHHLIKVGPGGEVTGAREAVERLAKERPALIDAPAGGGSPSAAGRIPARPHSAPRQPQVDMEAELRRHVRYQF